MEIYADVVDAQDLAPVPFATIQRHYPDSQGGGVYSSPIVANENGQFNGRVPARDYYWIVTSAGYMPQKYTLENAVSDMPNNPLIVKLQRNDSLPEVVITPGTSETDTGAAGYKKYLPWLALAAVLGFIGYEEKWFK